MNTDKINNINGAYLYYLVDIKPNTNYSIIININTLLYKISCNFTIL